MSVTKILGVDPGTTNLGYCLINATDASIISQGTISIAIDKTVKGAHAKIANGVVNALRESILNADHVTVEGQMRARMHIVNGSVLGASIALGKPVSVVVPCSVKRHFGLPLKVSYLSHKKNAIEKANQLGAGSVTSHAADAYLCARYAAEVILKTLKQQTDVGQSSVPNSDRRIRGSRLLSLFEGELRVPCAQTIGYSQDILFECTEESTEPAVHVAKRHCKSKQVQPGPVAADKS